MYTDEDLDYAVKKGILTDSAVKEFRALLSSAKNVPLVDEENFKLITGFNDIFVVIACLLLLFSSFLVLNTIDKVLGSFVFSCLAWGLTEFFVHERKMALPAIVLLLSLVGGVFVLCLHLTEGLGEQVSLIISIAVSAFTAYLHWLRYKVPITVAACTAATIGFLIATTLSIVPNSKDWPMLIAFASGIVVFGYAMYWDISDRNRITHRSDVAFWLHLLSAPLIVHPVFSALGILEGNESLSSIVIVIGLYLFMTIISVAIDRRAFMVSSLIYVLYALANLLKIYGGLGFSFALTGVLIGIALLLLSAFWHTSRRKLLKILPTPFRKYVPIV